MQKKHLKYAVLGIILSILLFPGVARASSPTPDEALADWNAWRAEAGELPVTEMKPEWNHGCELHNAYMAGTGVMTHYEESSSPFYTPEGADAGASSDLAGAPGTPRIFEAAVFHRAALLNPRLNISGFDASQGHTCVRVLGGEDPERRTPSLTAYPWPPNGAPHVETTFRAMESPDPRQYDPNGGQLGYLLSVNLNGPWRYPGNLTIYAASKTLTATDGSTDELVFKDMGYGAFGLFPADPLHTNIGYQVHVIGQADDRSNKTSYPFDISWQFRTDVPPPKESPQGEGDEAAGTRDCIVPKLRNKTLRQAKRQLVRAHCKLGKVTKSKRHTPQPVVISQKPRTGKTLPAWTKIAVRLG